MPPALDQQVQDRGMLSGIFGKLQSFCGRVKQGLLFMKPAVSADAV